MVTKVATSTFFVPISRKSGNCSEFKASIMGKRLIVCCDGTGNEVGGNLSNVLKLFRILEKTDTQRVYYQPGVGTISTDDRWARFRQDSKAVLGLATGYGLDEDILGGYRFISQNYAAGDEIFLFGFSRGAYTVRALAGFLELVGLLPIDQLNVGDYALTSYKKASEINRLKIASTFGRITGAKQVPIKFIGVWDTVASVIAPRRDRIFPTLQTLPFTRRNPAVQVFRHAMAIDERRRMFRLNRWEPVQDFKLNRFDDKVPSQPQDIKQVWFAGVHSDIGGGYPETESGLSKYPLQWMIKEATAFGVTINEKLRAHLVDGAPLSSGAQIYVPPNVTGDLHNSLTAGWKPLEWLPKSTRWMEWKRPSLLGYYLPDAEPRVIDDPVHRPRVHQSAVMRKSALPDYAPINFPSAYDIEPL